MLATSYPVGFELTSDDGEAYGQAPPAYAVVARSFAEFAWRWWMDNEIFYTVQVEGRPITAAQEDYIQQLGHPCLLEELSDAWWR